MSVVNSKKLFTKILDRIKLRDAASGGTDPSIVTTGEKYTWNHKSDVVVDNTLANSGQAADAKAAGDEIRSLKSSVDVFEPTATSSNIGQVLKAKTVSGGKVTEYEFGDAAIIDDTLTNAGEAADAKKVGDEVGNLKENLNTDMVLC